MRQDKSENPKMTFKKWMMFIFQNEDMTVMIHLAQSTETDKINYFRKYKSWIKNTNLMPKVNKDKKDL